MEKIKRCSWCGSDSLYIKYHDEEWGKPVFEDNVFFEFLILETFQAGLSWITILRKRENFRKAFDQFSFEKIALYDEKKITQLFKDEGIIRNKLKIRAAVSNARAFIEIRKIFGSFSNYIWNFVDYQPVINFPNVHQEVPATTELSDRISKDLKKRGFKFVGSTVMYAFLQATGIVNDHISDCSFK